jgi:hypothetical protein
MKLSIIFLAIVLMASITPQQTGNAKVSKVNGLDVFIFSTPLSDYEVVDSGKIIATLTGACGESVNAAIKKAGKVKADAVIINIENSRWEAIKYK